MRVASASSPPTAARPTEAQNSHQVGPKIKARPPIRNATMTRETATQDTVRPWNGSGGVHSVLAWLSWPPSVETPATAPEPGWSAMPLLLSDARPLGCACSSGRGPCCRCVRQAYCGDASLVVHAGPGLRARLWSRLGFAGGLAYDD